jgi:hypothetical protein
MRVEPARRPDLFAVHKPGASAHAGPVSAEPER